MIIKQLAYNMRSKFWYLPSIYSVFALLLAIGSMIIDRFFATHPSLYELIPSIFLSDLNLSQTILSSISTSLLTMTTITFSSILLVLTTFLSQFSPRALQNFITDHHTQRVLGIFVGGFIYSIILLLLVRDNSVSNLFIVPTFAIIVAIACLGVFVFFINHVTTWIKVSNLIFNITIKTTRSIEETLRDKNVTDTESPWEDWESEEIKTIEPYECKSLKSGYVQFIELEKLLKLATDEDCIIRIEKDLGDYVDLDTPLLSIWRVENVRNLDDYYNKISIITDQEPVKDIEFGIQKLVEIALRAISPAINDPYTAINSIEHLARMLSKLGKKELQTSFHHDSLNNLRIIFDKPTFDDYLYESFFQIRHYGKEDISIVVSVIKALTFIAESNTKEIKEKIWSFSSYIIEGLEQNNWLTRDKAFINTHLRVLAKTCSKQRLLKEI
ncbi:DUF2254 domain-containing protein [Metabacillus herbersteinensis]|uniref:DUF2254 domain-containing protein n=1 Tax=Metabacillus herbersteinensis TaxID=283816 RepID=A0ABV6GKU6_9BACI